MLPAANRLRRAADFRENARAGRRSTSGTVVASVLLADTADAPARVGVVVSKKVGGSVVRHAVARRLRSGAREILADLPAGSTLVLRALPGAGADRALTEHVRTAVDAAVAVARRRGRR